MYDHDGKYKPSRGYYVFKLRIAGSQDDFDFIEVEVSSKEISTYDEFLRFCCRELHIPKTGDIERIRKLPDTRVRSHIDVRRFNAFESLEFILKERQL